jgi:F-type H+-transporting ATPase subunit b
MSELSHQLGINWKLLLSQGVNFFVLLAALTFLVWRPLLRIMRERALKIEEGLADAETARQKLAEIDTVLGERTLEADRQAFAIIREAEKKAEERAVGIVQKADMRAEELRKSALSVIAQREQEEFEKFASSARSLVRGALAKAIEAEPAAVDDKLINEAVTYIRKEKTL